MHSTTSERELRQQIVAEAMKWLRTPYRNCANVLGVGVDCAMLIVEVYKKVGKCPADYDPRPYAPEWYLHRDEERYLQPMAIFGRRVLEESAVQPGDIAVYRYGRTASHGTIIVSDTLLIHANRVARCVELCERDFMRERLDSYWSVF